VKVGIHLPQWGPTANRRAVIEVARAAEDHGFDSVWVADHIVYPTVSSSRYPYRTSGLPFAAADGFLEAFTTLSVVAGATERVGLGTSVLVLPMREPLLVAKTVATLDVLSEGRVILAVGAGWWEEEFAALGAEFDDRGSRLDEQLQILRAAWRDGCASYEGNHYAFSEVACYPLPMQEGGPRLLIGGSGRNVWRRTALHGDAWHAVGFDPQLLRQGLAEIKEFATAAGREPGEISLSVSAGLGRSASDTVERLCTLHALGAAQAVLNIGGPAQDVGSVCRAMETFAADVRPQLPK
jgi:probable F420-dependent oxidoreductase